MNIGETVKRIRKDFPSVTISRLRFLEKEGLIAPSRSKGGTRDFSDKDINRILKILDLQENQFYTLKAIKNNPKLFTKSAKVNIVMQDYSLHDALKKSGISSEQFEDLINFNLESKKDKYTQDDITRLLSFSYFFSLGFTAKNFSIFKSMADRGAGFIDLVRNNIADEELSTAVENFTTIIGSFISKDL
tara:strand:+ start:122 stop:688 length:567 start_codon:yes stop_codon:yes gene_type:complete